MKCKLNMIKGLLWTLLAIGGVFTSCNNAEYSALGTRAYISEAEKESGTKVIVQIDTPTEIPLTVRISDKIDTSCKFELVADQQALDEYNKRNGTGYVILPDSCYILPSEIIIKAGEYAAESSNIIIKPFSYEMTSSGEQYALPLRLKSMDDKVESMNTTGTYVIATGSIIKYSAPVLNGNTQVSVNMSPGIPTLNTFTVEMRFQISAFHENQALFDGGGGGNDQVYIRLEDPAGKWNLIQIVGKGTYLNALTPFEANKWQHLAITYDGSKYTIYVNGKLDAQKGGLPAGSVSFPNIHFISSGPQWFPNNCMLNEVRLWSKALNETQIKNNMTVVSPKSDGLKAYWKMDEGKGNVFKDATGHGYDATAAGTVTWVPNILSTDSASPWN